jgi:hypothetical protein
MITTFLRALAFFVLVLVLIAIVGTQAEASHVDTVTAPAGAQVIPPLQAPLHSAGTPGPTPVNTLWANRSLQRRSSAVSADLAPSTVALS